MADAELLARARGGDGEAFRELTAPYRRELLAHCYRMLASVQDAEDVVQDTMLAAWQHLGSFEERASVRTWLYRIATNRCLNALRSAASRRPAVPASVPPDDSPEPRQLSEVSWLEPYPDLLMEGIPDRRPGPEARYEASETISLAFVAALQLLPPRQRAALILCDVLGYRAAEVADLLGTSYGAAASALKHARAAMTRYAAAGGEPPPPPDSAAEQALVRQLTAAYTAADVDGLVALLTEDVRLAMPPHPFEYRGRAVAAQGLGLLLAQGHRDRLIATRANGQPALALYRQDPQAGLLRASGLLVLTLAGPRISAMTMFTPAVLARFGLPRTLPA